MSDLSAFFGPNAGYVLELYDRYLENPDAVDAETRQFFETFSPNSSTYNSTRFSINSLISAGNFLIRSSM